MGNLKRFHSRSIDVSAALPVDWVSQINQVADSAKSKKLIPNSVTSRESKSTPPLSSLVVDGRTIKIKIPWLFALYKTIFRNYVQAATKEAVAVARDDLHGIAINVLHGADMRYECHVDSNPIGAILYTRSFEKGDGGELVFGNNPQARSVHEVDADASVVFPEQGHLLIFDGKTYPHYVRPVLKSGVRRVAVVFNFYTPACTESDRPLDLDEHLFGELSRQHVMNANHELGLTEEVI